MARHQIESYCSDTRRLTGPESDGVGKKLAEAKEKVGYEKLLLDVSDRSVRFAVNGMRLDLGGIAKGYAVDRMTAVLLIVHFNLFLILRILPARQLYC